MLFLQRNPLSLSLYLLPCYDNLVLKHHFAINLSLFLNMCSRGTLLTCKMLFLLYFIIYSYYFLSMRSSELLHPHHRAIPSLSMENMWLATIFTGSSRKDGTGIFLSIFSFDDFITLPWAPIHVCLIKAQIVMMFFLAMKSMIKQQWHNAYSTIFIIAPSSILLDLPSKCFGHSCYSVSSPLLSAASHFLQAFV